MVGLITDASSAAPMSMHFTFLQADGNKAPVDGSRLYLPGHRKTGGVIRLWPDAEVATGLLIGEGIETALSGARHFAPTWAALDAGNLGRFSVLNGIEALTILADDDDAGRRAAETCAARWRAAAREVRIWAAT